MFTLILSSFFVSCASKPKEVEDTTPTVVEPVKDEPVIETVPAIDIDTTDKSAMKEAAAIAKKAAEEARAKARDNKAHNGAKEVFNAAHKAYEEGNEAYNAYNYDQAINSYNRAVEEFANSVDASLLAKQRAEAALEATANAINTASSQNENEER